LVGNHASARILILYMFRFAFRKGDYHRIKAFEKTTSPILDCITLL
jgi:hypothetical protein